VHGYAATTTLLVAEEAGISRGAMLHQFPTKTDLMLFVMRSVYDDEVMRFSARLNAPNHTEADLHEVMWETLSRPSGAAALEILLGARSDQRLAEKLVPLQAQIEREAIAIAAAMNPDGDSMSSPNAVRLVMWAMRGLAMANLVAGNPDEISEMVGLFRQVLVTYRDNERQKKSRGQPQ
jgi:AcrR family transcriptional regulator